MKIYKLENGKKVVDVQDFLDTMRMVEANPEIPIKNEGNPDYEAIWKSFKKLLEFEIMTKAMK